MDITAIKEARERIRPFIKSTPLEHSEALSQYLNQMSLSKYDSFKKRFIKVRGALINY